MARTPEDTKQIRAFMMLDRRMKLMTAMRLCRTILEDAKDAIEIAVEADDDKGYADLEALACSRMELAAHTLKRAADELENGPTLTEQVG